MDKLLRAVPILNYTTIGMTYNAFFGRKDLPPQVRKDVEKMKDYVVSAITINRTPLTSFLNGALNTVSLGHFSKVVKEKPYDKLFHLYIHIRFTNGKKIGLEKNEVIRTFDPKKRPNNEDQVVERIPQNLTFGQLMENTSNYMGKNFIIYDPLKNNCQDFILSVFKANNIGTEKDYEFIKQDAENLLGRTSHGIARGITDLGARVSAVIEGQGIKPRGYGLDMVDGYTLNPVRYCPKIKKSKRKGNIEDESA